MQSEPPKADPPKRKRRWFQYSLRTLLIFTLICAIASAWLGRRIEQKRNERQAVEAIIKVFGTVTYDYQKVKGAKPPGPDWLRKLLGENFFSEVSEVEFQAFFFTGRQHLDASPDLQDFRRFVEEHHEHLVYVKWSPEIQMLEHSTTNVADAELAYVKELTKLKSLQLSGTMITDAGLVNLIGLSQLQLLELQGTGVTDSGVKELQRALPNCKIER
jgi:hypothetical protein